eukprot:7410534-Prorocentrum_lima.AAC.1
MGRNIKVVTGKASPDTLVLPGVLHGSPFSLKVFVGVEGLRWKKFQGKEALLERTGRIHVSQ